MAYRQFVPLVNLNFQINRVLTNGPDGCDEDELWEIAPYLTDFDGEVWHAQWRRIALRAEREGRFMHAANYYRMSEFFLPDSCQEKADAYRDFKRCFYTAVANTSLETFQVSYGNATLPVIRLKARQEKGIILLHGGFDSFMEEFYLAFRRLPERGYTVLAFEGPGQGGPLRQGLTMDHQWEKPVGALLDHFGLKDAGLIGISLGGYLALRAAAFDPRITRVVAFDIVWDALAAFTEKFHPDLYDLVIAGKSEEVNAILEKQRKTHDMVDWMVSHGMYITGGRTPFEYLDIFSRFTTREISHRVRQDILLLAGENDHFVPPEFYLKQKQALVNARSVKGRFFTAAEGGDQHCQVGELDLAWNAIIDWLKDLHDD